MKAVAYVRVSTDKQDLSPAAQRKAIQAWCRTNGADLCEVFEDIGISGSAELADRPGLLAAVNTIAVERAEALVVAKRDRLARDVFLSSMIERLVQRLGARIVSADGIANDSTPEAELMRHLLSAFAAYERALIRVRTKAAMNAKRERGEHLGGDAPFGFSVRSGRLIPNQKERKLMSLVRRLYSRGWSLRKIGEHLGKKGFKNRAGRRVWNPNSVRKLVGGEAR